MISTADVVPPELLADLKRRHAEPHRHYHDWTHVEALLAHARGAQELIADQRAVVLAILFHDAIYDPIASDNERRSAQLLIDLMPSAMDASLETARRMILATEGHRLPSDLQGTQRDDAALFLDMDIAILGAPAPWFDRYEEQIRREYAFVPEDAYRQGRANVLRGFAQREPIYVTNWGRAGFEEQARQNLARSIARLNA